jgi:UDP-N-acetylglucosamine acyltransferase
VEIGDENTIREFVTINRGTVKGGGVTSIGSHNLLMACCHVAHDCEIADHVIIGNNTLLAGHIKVEERANISGLVGCNQFVTIGAYSYVGGMTRMVHDAPPFMILEGHPSSVRGVNTIGLQRAGMDNDEIRALRDAHKRIWRTLGTRSEAFADLAESAARSVNVARLLEALERTASSKKGRYRENLRESFMEQGRRRILGGESS